MAVRYSGQWARMGDGRCERRGRTGHDWVNSLVVVEGIGSQRIAVMWQVSQRMKLPRARERFAQKMLGTSPTSEATGHLVSTAGTRVPVEVSAVSLRSGETVVGVFGLIEGRPDESRTAPPPPHLTPRQVEVLRLLEQGCSTKQIAAELHLSTETVRNHVRRLFRALGVHSRLEAVAAARAASPD